MAFLKVGESLVLLNPSPWFEKAIKEMNNYSSRYVAIVEFTFLPILHPYRDWSFTFSDTIL